MSSIDEVKSRIDIVDLVGQYVTLQRAGRNYKAVCPFHSEKTPSFIVTPERQTWHCFGACGTGGDIFSFVMKREDIDFGEALRQLAERAGVTLAERGNSREDERRERLLEVNEAAASYFHQTLRLGPAAEGARSYLESRGLDAETIETFQLGYGPEAWDALKSHLTERGFTQEELLTTGLLVESDRGGYDRFRNRLMFPIRDERGRVVGFGGRALASTQEAGSETTGAKYINTPQTPMFDKGALLFALDRAKETIRRERSVVIVEGYMDVIAAHQHGMSNVVASMGTALTERQIRALERFKAKILLALDADAAGMEATLRALQEAEVIGAVRASSTSAHPTALSEAEFSRKAQEWSRDALKRATVNFYVVPLSGKDPDEMIRADPEAWHAAIAGARPFTDHVFATVAARKDLSQPGERAELLQELLPVVRLIEEPVYRAHYVQRLARLSLVEEDIVRSALGRSRRTMRRKDETPTDSVPQAPREQGEEFCLALLLRHPALRRSGLALGSELFLLGEHRAIFDAWRETPEPEKISKALPAEIQPHLDRILGQRLPLLEGTELEEALQDCVRRIEFRRLSAAKRASTAALASFEARDEVSAAVEEAHALLQDADPAGSGSTQSDSRRSEIATALVEDMEVGRRLHQTPPAPASMQPVESPSGEADHE